MRTGRVRRRALAAGIVCAVAAGGPGAALGQDQYTLLVTGASGESQFAERFDDWRGRLVTALRTQPGFDDDHLVVLAETPGPGIGRASRAGVRQALDRLADRMTDTSVLHVVLIGHGSFDGIDAKFNLVGPDLEAAEWASLLDPLPGRVVFVNTASASAPFLQRLSARGRTVITATESAAQRFDTMFPQFFVDAFEAQNGDADKDGRVSVLEAFEFASRGVREWYRQQGRLATERALIDDTGDGRGKEAGEPGPDGLASARLYLAAGVSQELETTDPALAPLLARREALLDAIDDLRAARETMDPAEYLEKLEPLFVGLATVSRGIRQRRAGS